MLGSLLLKKNVKKINFKENSYILIGGLIICVILIIALLGPYFLRYDPLEVNGSQRLLSPSFNHFFGTDQYGRDILSRIIYGIRNSLTIGILVVFISTFLGILIGVIAGYYDYLDNILMRILDGIMAFPGIIIAITLCAVWGFGKRNIILALSFSYFPTMARIVRANVMSIKKSEAVDSIRTIGANDFYIIYKYILLNSLAPIIVQATFIFATSILDEAALSFLGVGIKLPQPSLGGMITEAKEFMLIAPLQIIFPGIFIMIIVLGLNLLGDGLRDYLDPKIKKR